MGSPWYQIPGSGIGPDGSGWIPPKFRRKRYNFPGPEWVDLEQQMVDHRRALQQSIDAHRLKGWWRARCGTPARRRGLQVRQLQMRRNGRRRGLLGRRRRVPRMDRREGSARTEMVAQPVVVHALRGALTLSAPPLTFTAQIQMAPTRGQIPRMAQMQSLAFCK